MYFATIILILAIGATIVIKSDWIYQFTGPIEWAEAHLGTEGGTRLFIKLIGVLIILGTFLWITGALQGMILAIFKPLVGTL